MGSLLKCGRHLFSMGYKIINLKKQSKSPLENEWQKKPRKSWQEIADQHRDKMNLGACMGVHSKLGDYFAAVIDCDVKSEDPRHLEELNEALGKLCPNHVNAPTTQSGRGFGSRHIWIKTKQPAQSFDFKKSDELVQVHMPSTQASSRDTKQLGEKKVKLGYRIRPAWEISVLGEGKQVVIPGSIHPDTKNKYMWSKPLQHLDDLPLLNLQPAIEKKHVGTKRGSFEPVKVDLEKYRISVEKLGQLKDGTGVTDRSAALLGMCSYLLLKGMSDEEILSLLTDEQYFLGEVAYDHANSSDRSRAVWWLETQVFQKAKNQYESLNAFTDEPEPTDANTDQDFPTFSENVRIGPVKMFLDQIEGKTEADNANLLFQFLAAIGSLLGRSSYAQVGGTKHHPNIFVGIVGKSAKARKGTGWGIVKETISAVDPTWLKRYVSGLSSGEGLIHAVRDESVELNNKKKLVAIPGVEDKRLLIVETEFANVIRQLERSGNNLSIVLRNAWDDQPLRTLTKNSPCTATDTHISLIGHITKDELSSQISGVDISNGFANRFIWVFVQRNGQLPFGGNGEALYTPELIENLQKAIVFAKTNRCLVFSEKAKTIWKKVYEELAQEKSGRVGQITARGEANTLRLSLIYALLDCSEKIQARHVTAAYELWKYSELSSTYIFSGCSPAETKLLERLRLTPLTRTQIVKDVFQGNTSKPQIDAILSNLIKQNKIQENKGSNTSVWELVRTTNQVKQ